jgi:hypothetical protein
MKLILIGMSMLSLIAAPAFAQGTVAVRGHVTRDGVYVAPSVRTAPNSTTTDNWSSKGNVNPYTGKVGTVDPYAPKPAPKLKGW